MTVEPQRGNTDNDNSAVKPRPSQTDGRETTPAEEWGEGIDTGKTIARGGKDHGTVPGAEEDKS